MKGRGSPLTARAVASTGALIAALAALDLWFAVGNGLEADFGLYLLERLFFLLPIGAALLVGQAPATSLRGAVLVCLATTLAMAAQDLAPARESTVGKRTVAYNPLDGTWAARNVESLIRAAEGGSFRLIYDHATGALEGAAETSEAYPETSPRLQVTYAFWKLGYLLAPFAAIGAVLGTRAWVRANLRARTRNAERVLLFALTWVVGPGTAVILATSADILRGVVLMRGPLPLILLAPVGIATTAAFGWGAAARQEAVLDSTAALPESD